MLQDCNQVKLLITAFIHKELSETDQAKVAEHLRECSICKKFYNKLKLLENKLKFSLPVGKTQSMKANLLQAISTSKKEKTENNNLIRFQCPKCSKHFSAEAKFVGKKLKCAKCSTYVSIPAKSTLPPKEKTVVSKANLKQPRTNFDVDVENNETPLAGSLPIIKAPAVQRYSEPKRSSKESSRNIRSNSDIYAASASKPRKTRRVSSNQNKPRNTQRRTDYAEPKKNNNALYVAVGSAVVLLLFIAILFLSGGNDTPPTIAETDTTPDIQPYVQPKIIPNSPNNGVMPGQLARPVPPLRFDSTIPSELGQYSDFNVKIEIEGGKGPYTWKIIGELPKGLNFTNGEFSRWAESYGNYKFSVQVEDSTGQIKTMDIDLEVYPEFRADYLSVPELELYQEVDYRISAEGGKFPYTCDVKRVNLPKGLDFIPEKFNLIGAPQEPGKYEIEIIINDALDQEITWSFEWTIYEPEPEPEPDDQIKNPPDDPSDPNPVEPRRPSDPRPNPQRPSRQPSQTELALKLQQLRVKAHNFYVAKKYQESIDAYEEILAISEDDTNALYNIACNYSLMKKKDEAVEYLERAIRAGFSDLNHILNDKDFDNIKRTKGFKNLTKDQNTINKMSIDAVEKQLAKEFPPEKGFQITVDHDNKLIFATNLGENEKQCNAILDLLTQRLRNYAKVQWKLLFKNRPDYYIKVILPTKEFFDVYKKQRGFPVYAGGWYSNNTHFLIAGTMGHTLTHEFTHALHFADQGSQKVSMNIWFVEGLATVFEDCKLPEKSSQKPEPIHNNRFNTAKQVITKDRDGTAGIYIPWRKFFKLNQRQFMPDGRRGGISYACARYITYWLWETKKLKRFYDNYMETFKKDRTGILAMEMTFKKSLEEIEEDWKVWLEKQRMESPKAYLGIRLANKAEATGMVIFSVEKGTGAEKAGLKSGDIIVALNRMAIDNTANLREAITECKIGQTIVCIIIRDGMPIEFKIKLGKRPKGLR